MGKKGGGRRRTGEGKGKEWKEGRVKKNKRRILERNEKQMGREREGEARRSMGMKKGRKERRGRG